MRLYDDLAIFFIEFVFIIEFAFIITRVLGDSGCFSREALGV